MRIIAKLAPRRDHSGTKEAHSVIDGKMAVEDYLDGPVIHPWPGIGTPFLFTGLFVLVSDLFGLPLVHRMMGTEPSVRQVDEIAAMLAIPSAEVSMAVSIILLFLCAGLSAHLLWHGIEKLTARPVTEGERSMRVATLRAIYEPELRRRRQALWDLETIASRVEDRFGQPFIPDGPDDPQEAVSYDGPEPRPA